MVRAIRASLIGEFFGSRNVCFTLMDGVTTIAHRAAYELCNILHCDISPSNILISKENAGGGLLIDWDLCKHINSTERKARRAARTVRIECLFICTGSTAGLMNWNQGTWQFMAADLIANPFTPQTYVHDLESAFYVMFWLSLKYLPSSYSPSKRGMILSTVFNPKPAGLPYSRVRSSVSLSLQNDGDEVKVNWMANSNDVTQFKVTGNKPLSDLLSTLKTLLGARHVNVEIMNELLNSHFQSNTGQAQVQFKAPTVEYSDILMALDEALEEQWPNNDSARLQKIELPMSSRLGALSGSKRTKDAFLSSHNSQPVHSELIGSSNSKRQKN